MSKIVNPVIVTTLTQCIADFNARATEYVQAEEWGLAELATEDANYNQKCLNSYKRTGNYDKLIHSLTYQDTLPREQVIWAMMQAGCYEETNSKVAEFTC